MQKDTAPCGCGGPRRPVGEASVRGGFGTTGENRPLFYLAHLVAQLEKQAADRKAKCPPDAPVDGSGPKNGDS